MNNPFGTIDPETPHGFEPDSMFPGLCEHCGVPRAKHPMRNGGKAYCWHSSVLTSDGSGSYCRYCGETQS